MMDAWKDLPIGDGAPRAVTAVVVTPKDSVNVYAYRHKIDSIELAHVINTPYRPPGDICLVPQTYAEGGPLDAVVLSASPNPPKTLIECRTIGILRILLDGARADSLLCAPVRDASCQNINGIGDVNPHMLEEVRGFFERLFRAQSRVARVDEWLGTEEARRSVALAHTMFKRKFGPP